MNIKICDFFHGAASPTATHPCIRGVRMLTSLEVNYNMIKISHLLTLTIKLTAGVALKIFVTLEYI